MAGDIVGKIETLTFHMQIGLVRESVTVQMESGNLTLTTLKDIACAFVDRKVISDYRNSLFNLHCCKDLVMRLVDQ